MRFLQRLMLSLAAAALLVPIAPTLAKAPSAARAVVHPLSGLPVIPLRVHGHRFRVELAKTPAQQQKGLMLRQSMGADEGMLFPESSPRQVAFWMRNTILPLDIVFIGPDRRIVNIVNAIPFDETPLPSAGPVIAVLELNAGRTKALGIKVGDRVDW
ncbi:MAG TPA: DUF192 domain-containing protein [Novosphingobium sp.]|nr:DUF192 domain-containing protein [Novosphingobium sp.]